MSEPNRVTKCCKVLHARQRTKTAVAVDLKELRRVVEKLGFDGSMTGMQDFVQFQHFDTLDLPSDL